MDKHAREARDCVHAYPLVGAQRRNGGDRWRRPARGAAMLGTGDAMGHHAVAPLPEIMNEEPSTCAHPHVVAAFVQTHVRTLKIMLLLEQQLRFTDAFDHRHVGGSRQLAL